MTCATCLAARGRPKRKPAGVPAAWETCHFSTNGSNHRPGNLVFLARGADFTGSTPDINEAEQVKWIPLREAPAPDGRRLDRGHRLSLRATQPPTPQGARKRQVPTALARPPPTSKPTCGPSPRPGCVDRPAASARDLIGRPRVRRLRFQVAAFKERSATCHPWWSDSQ